MRKFLTAAIFSAALVASAAVQAAAQDKAVDKAKDAGQTVADKTVEAKDATVKDTKKTGNWFKRTWHKVF